jgi:hypothetical protein
MKRKKPPPPGGGFFIHAKFLRSLHKNPWTLTELYGIL